MRVIRYVRTTPNYVKMYEVVCIKCGKTKEIQYARLNSRSCCYHSNKVCGIYLEEYDEYIGRINNDYKVIRQILNDRNGFRYLCKCNMCGMEHENYISNFLRGYGTRHTDCPMYIKNDKYIARFKKIYSCMRYRTTNEKYNEYYLYGGRGICSDYYSDFMIFYTELYDSYVCHVKEYGTKNTTIDRIDVNGNYESGNVRWATIKEQANNKRNNKKKVIKIKKVIIVLNGTGTSGKGELAKALSLYKKTIIISSVDLVKDAATILGYNDNVKDEKSRKFVSDMKLLATEYNDSPFNYLSNWVKSFKHKVCDAEILTMDIREPNEIKRAVNEFGAVTVLVKRKEAPNIMSNMADANVDNYNYDYIIYNDGTLEDLQNEAKKLIDKLF